MRKTAVAPLCGKRRRALCIKRLIVLSGLQTILVAAPCPAESLPELLQEAAQHDAKFASADAQFRAAIQKEPEARAALLPHLGLSQSVFRNGIFVPGKSPESYSTLGTSLSLNQAVFKWDDWQSYQEGKLSAISAGFGLAAARQDLLLRTAQAYFDALAAQDQHVLAREHVRTLDEQLAISQRGFNLGTATIVDLNEAQAGADAAQSDLVHASAEVLKRYAAIEKIVAHPVTDVDAFAPDVSAPAIGADGADHWADTAQRESFDVRQQEIALEIAMREVSKVNAGYLPSVSIVGNINHGNAAFINGQTSFYTGANRASSGEIGIQINIPLFDGLQTSSKKAEALALQDKARGDLEDARRSAALDARESFLALQESVAQIAALRTAQLSAETSLKSNQKGFKAGVRINADVLGAAEKLFTTRRDLAKARYDAVMQFLRLRASVARLDETTLEDLANASVKHSEAQQK
ncbi:MULTISPECIES: TolC family outer membrane protein [Caballeronia]|uniref:TolC family outer membrane protein n=1 Tax=Caballeronia jiangsuensis TaxID=1458357 RepID=A0ABW9CWM2_9BURK|nr:TolC family outer membrane protein [Caballeronia sp. GaOx3]